MTGVDEDDEDEDERIEKPILPEVVVGQGERSWTLEELVKYQRTGVVPLS